MVQSGGVWLNDCLGATSEEYACSLAFCHALTCDACSFRVTPIARRSTRTKIHAGMCTLSRKPDPIPC